MDFPWCTHTQTHTTHAHSTYKVVDADAVPALHYRQERDEGRNNPTAADHQSHSHGRHFVPVDQRLAADSVVPAGK